jgi:hypothetical protein
MKWGNASTKQKSWFKLQLKAAFDKNSPVVKLLIQALVPPPQKTKPNKVGCLCMLNIYSQFYFNFKYHACTEVRK